ncbi:MAG TPA: hypothetical protein VIM30_02635 [Candidatus Limnocylindrales bacterium]|jgi:hypothetical protein
MKGATVPLSGVSVKLAVNRDDRVGTDVTNHQTLSQLALWLADVTAEAVFAATIDVVNIAPRPAAYLAVDVPPGRRAREST